MAYLEGEERREPAEHAIGEVLRVNTCAETRGLKSALSKNMLKVGTKALTAGMNGAARSPRRHRYKNNNSNNKTKFIASHSNRAHVARVFSAQVNSRVQTESKSNRTQPEPGCNDDSSIANLLR